MDYLELYSQEVPTLFQDIPSSEILVYQVIFVFTLVLLIGLDYLMLRICQ